MNTDNVSDFPMEPRVIEARMSETRPLYWSVRRELWENKSIYLAPLIVAAVVLFGSFFATVSAASGSKSGTKDRRAAVLSPMKMAPAPIMLASFIVAAFYCLDALYGERRDRSILFWKSMPVSDTTAVIAKAAIPMVVLPAIVLGLCLIVKLILTVVSAGVLAGTGLGTDPLERYPFFASLIVMVYGYYAHILWFAPLFGWLMLVSAWARRMPVLWAVLPPLGLMAFEAMIGTNLVRSLIAYRFKGAMREAFAPHARDGNVNRLADLAPLNFFTTPGLWIGLMVAAAFFFAAARLRSKQEPA